MIRPASGARHVKFAELRLWTLACPILLRFIEKDGLLKRYEAGLPLEELPISG